MKLRVRVPASTANLGPGFDCLGLALDWWNTIQVEPLARGLQVECQCDQDVELPCDDRNLVVQAMRSVYRRARKPFPPLRIQIECEIPVGRGLGSSGAAIVGGVVAANALLGNRFSQSDLLDMAADIEGHPDNVAPSLLGGLVIAVRDGATLRTLRTPVPRGLHCVLFIPGDGLSTKLARSILPEQVSRADAVYNVGRAALWIAALDARRWEWLNVATQDRLHQPYRTKLIRGMDELFRAARKAGANGIALSGSGPSVVAFADQDGASIERALARTAARLGLAGRTRIVRASSRGARVDRIGSTRK